MPEVFINYRTGDGNKTSITIERELSHRFGSERIFRASKSIPLGSQWPEELLVNARRCAVLIAVIGPKWAQHEALRDPQDWVRRELLEAHRNNNTIIAVMDGHEVDRLRSSDLPPELDWFATSQSYRLDEHNIGRDLNTLGDKLSELVPALRAADASRADSAVPQLATNSVGEAYGTVLSGVTVTDGDAGGTIVKGTSGAVNVGPGNFYNNSPQFSGNGVNYTAGSHTGDINQRFSVAPEAPGQE
ncbi:toll/interleukin-1 receptor domain-containing protein [Parafrankia sp. FMc2]|uniref:toll/interleukin-1 receptor domain-containing protein n=1 Tax=Parafrankia sp. FMc2 TaxID=3233196 RepID=UPI0034D77A16